MTNREQCEIEARHIATDLFIACIHQNSEKPITEALLKLRDENEKLKDELLRQLKNKEELQEKLKVARGALYIIKEEYMQNVPMRKCAEKMNEKAKTALQQIGEV